MTSPIYLLHLLKLTKLFHTGFNFITADNIPKPNWRTNRKYPLSKGEFIKLHSDPLNLLGVSFGQKTRYVMIDIDIDSSFHPNNDSKAYARLLLALEKIELTYPIHIRSSRSGGIHIYYFFPHPVSTFRLAALIRVTLINAGFQIKNGQLEIFPNTKAYSEDKTKPSYYKAHRLPLQPDSGACLLDQWGDELICSANLTDEGKLEKFLIEAQKSAETNNIKWIESKLDWAYNLFKQKIAKYQHHASNYSEVAQEWKENLELTIDIGWTDYHQTNELIPIFVCYGIVFEGLEDKQALFDWVHQKITTTRGYSEYCRHKNDIGQRIQDWVDSSINNQYYVKYCGFPPRCGITPHQLVALINPNRQQVNLHNQNLAERTKQRLNDILAALEQLPKKIGDRLTAIQAKCQELFGESISRNTLYRSAYKSMWAGRERGEDLENTIPLANIVQTIDIIENYCIPPEIFSEIETPQNLTVEELSHTPPIYEVFIADLPTSPDPLIFHTHVPLLSSISQIDSYQENSSIFSIDSQLESSPPELKLELEASATSSDLCSEQPRIETTLAAVDYRPVFDIARDVRANISAINDDLLREFLDHPQCEAIELTIELANQLVTVQTPDLVREVVADLAHQQKIDLWRTLRDEERTAVETLMSQSLPPLSPTEVVTGNIVTTLTGLLGVVKHVFKSLAKPFVVYHEELNRTIRYTIDDLRLQS
jgi:hypothetical protein